MARDARNVVVERFRFILKAVPWDRASFQLQHLALSVKPKQASADLSFKERSV